MSLRKFGAVITKYHGEVCILRHSRTQCFKDIDLTRRVIHMIVSTYHVSDTHIQIINHHTKIIGGRAVAASDDEIIQLILLKPM